MHFKRGERTENNPVFMKFYTLYKSMMQRCYLESSGSYHNYGAKGVTVSEEWRDLNNFLDTIETIDGYDFERIMAGELQLDKDIKYPGNKEYSPTNCMFVTASDNSGNRPTNSNLFVAVRPDYTYDIYRNREKFCRENGLDTRHVFTILNSRRGTHKEWQFFWLDEFSEEKIVIRRKFEAVSPGGRVYVYENHAAFAREHGLSPSNISMVLSGKNAHHKGWKFKELEISM